MLPCGRFLMRSIHLRLAIAALGAAVLAANVSAEPSKSRTYSFDQDTPGKPPAGFSFAYTKNIGRPGKWVVEASRDALSGGNTLVQIDKDDTNARYPLAVTTQDAPVDLRVSVKCKAASGDVDQACGIVFRYRDENNYYVTRSNVLEDNVRLYYVKDGKRTQIATWDGKVPGMTWNQLAVEAKGDAFTVFWNGKKIIEQRDATFARAGKVGLWTKADSITSFDDLTVSPL